MEAPTLGIIIISGSLMIFPSEQILSWHKIVWLPRLLGGLDRIVNRRWLDEGFPA
jgi:hypothetical protein